MKTIKKIGLVSAVAVAMLAFSACDDSSSAGGDETGVSSSSVESPDSSVTLSPSTSSGQAPESAESNGSSDENMEKDKSSSSENKSSSSAKETKVSSDSKSSSSVKSGDSSSSKKDNSSSSVNSSSSEKQNSSSSTKQSSSSVVSSSSGEYVPYDHWAVLGPRRADSVFKQFVDTRNNRSYYYLTIYNKVHSDSLTVFAENLNIGEMVDGAKDQSDNDKIERYCYDNDTTNCDRYGGLYQWAEMMGFNDSCNTKSCAHLIDENHQGICPQDWRIMTYDDFQFILKSENVTHGIDDLKTQNGFGGYNTTGFSVVGPGYNWDHTFRGFQESTYFFYPQERDDSTTIPSGMSRGTTSTSHTWKLKTHGFSVRCVMIYKKSENN
ncbi:major paralogous domain-containing protein [Fibrobacter sp. UWR3]|uniref:FISUMP domain-containing protein n=1 Tax=Fibrobacter sp. UWR3 TaxID=1896217 RepID=UPI00091591F9|nr:FISUMP domain-containing protein [Fibrobacter sp. UWR3]SHN07547.1 major paralogous domain-containing protein [Fibrobacter sp. UWR3]